MYVCRMTQRRIQIHNRLFQGMAVGFPEPLRFPGGFQSHQPVQYLLLAGGGIQSDFVCFQHDPILPLDHGGTKIQRFQRQRTCAATKQR